MLEKLQNGHVFYMYGVVFEHDKGSDIEMKDVASKVYVLLYFSTFSVC